LKNAIAIAEGECGGEVCYLGEMEASDASMTRVVKRITAKYICPDKRRLVQNLRTLPLSSLRLIAPTGAPLN
jgi:hypothetical protein